jgi:release factor glutamine methyltransferase
VSAPIRADLLGPAIERLRQAGVEGPERDARLLLRWASGLEAAALSARLTDPPEPEEARRFSRAIAAREARKPLAQITGIRDFWGRRFMVTPDVLDPRPETETLIAGALSGPPVARILDLGTGTGCLLLTLLAEWPGTTGLGTDISPRALEVAAGNARALSLSDRAAFTQSDWCVGLGGPFGLVVSNPPYIARSEHAELAPEVRLHEPRQALVPAGDTGDGLAAYRNIARGLGPLLAPGGRVMLEIGPTQAAEVTNILAGSGLGISSVLRDLDGRDRVVCAIAA